MAVKLIIPTPLRQYTAKKDSVEVEAHTVSEALAKLTEQFADLRRHLFNDEGKLRSFVNVYLNDEDIRYLQNIQTPVKENDTLSIVPSIAGGSPRRCCCSGGPRPPSGVCTFSPEEARVPVTTPRHRRGPS